MDPSDQPTFGIDSLGAFDPRLNADANAGLDSYSSPTFTTSDQSMFGMENLGVFDPLLFGAEANTPSDQNSDLNGIMNINSDMSISKSNMDNPPLLTPNTLGLISCLWTPSIDTKLGNTQYSSNDQLGYFDNAVSPMSANPPVMTTRETEQTLLGKRKSQASQSEDTAAAPPEKKKRRARKKKVRSEEEDRRTRENFLERNRKAAQKCRQRKKVWMEDVQQKKDAASELMNILGMEVIQLVDEVKQLRAFVDEHKDCGHENFEVSKEHPVSDALSHMAAQAAQASTFLEKRRDSNSTDQTASTDRFDGEDAPTYLSLEQPSSEYRDPCWKLALEASKRFSEIHPGALPLLPRLSRHNAPAKSRGNAIDSIEDDTRTHSRHTSYDDANNAFEQRTDSGYSEMSTPHDTGAVSDKLDFAKQEIDEGLATIVPASITMIQIPNVWTD